MAEGAGRAGKAQPHDGAPTTLDLSAPDDSGTTAAPPDCPTATGGSDTPAATGGVGNGGPTGTGEADATDGVQCGTGFPRHHPRTGRNWLRSSATTTSTHRAGQCRELAAGKSPARAGRPPYSPKGRGGTGDQCRDFLARRKWRCNGDSATCRDNSAPASGLCDARQWGGLSLTPLYVILIGGASEATSGRASPGRSTVRQHLVPPARSC